MLRQAGVDTIVEGMKKTVASSISSGTSHFVDFREGGIEGVDMMVSAMKDFPGTGIVMARPSGTAGDEGELDSEIEQILSKAHMLDNALWVNDSCDKCGICVRVCPVENITLSKTESPGPTWLHKCINCLACYHHCPQESIQFGK